MKEKIEKIEKSDYPDDLPFWVGMWIPPSRKPFLAYALLIVGTGITVCLPFLLNIEKWDTSDLCWWFGIAGICFLWNVLALVWMYRHNKWQSAELTQSEIRSRNPLA